MSVVYLANPTYDGSLHMSAMQAVQAATNQHVVINNKYSYSALTLGFNQHWCTLLNNWKKYEIEYFVMLHADVGVVTECWVDKLIMMLVEYELDVLGVVVPIKNEKGLTSTCVVEVMNNRVPFRLTMSEVDKLPTVFNLADIVAVHELPVGKRLDEYCIGINTGCFIVKVGEWIERYWIKHTDRGDVKTNNFAFQFIDWIEFDEVDKQWKPGFIPEDWLMSVTFSRLGLEVAATASIALDHYGIVKFSNQGSWGSLQQDDFKL